MGAVDRFDLLAMMALILVLLYSEGASFGGGEATNRPMEVVALFGLLYRPMRLRWAFLFVLAGLFVLGSAVP